MRVQLAFAPAEGEEPDYSLDFDMPGVPQPGDFVTITRPGQSGSADFRVRRRLWTLVYPDVGPQRHVGASPIGKTCSVTVECEFTVGPLASEEHKRAVERHTVIAPCGPSGAAVGTGKSSQGRT